MGANPALQENDKAKNNPPPEANEDREGFGARLGRETWTSEARFLMKWSFTTSTRGILCHRGDWFPVLRKIGIREGDTAYSKLRCENNGKLFFVPSTSKQTSEVCSLRIGYLVHLYNRVQRFTGALHQVAVLIEHETYNSSQYIMN